jgi:hypothetical protein
MSKQSSSREPTFNNGHLDYDDDHVKLEIPKITWYKEPGLRKLYMMMPIFFLGSTTNGYDGSLLNGLQTMVPWRDCMWWIKISLVHLLLTRIAADFDNPSGSRLGLFNAIQNVGGMASILFGRILQSSMMTFTDHCTSMVYRRSLWQENGYCCRHPHHRFGHNNPRSVDQCPRSSCKTQLKR